MKIILSNNKELSPIMVTGATKYIQGANRDTLSFIFHGTESMEALDEAFSPEACESITITGDDDSVNIYKSYSVRVKLEKALVEVTPATPETEAVMADRITVTMAQRTYTETQLAILKAMMNAN